MEALQQQMEKGIELLAQQQENVVGAVTLSREENRRQAERTRKQLVIQQQVLNALLSSNIIDISFRFAHLNPYLQVQYTWMNQIMQGQQHIQTLVKNWHATTVPRTLLLVPDALHKGNSTWFKRTLQSATEAAGLFKHSRLFVLCEAPFLPGSADWLRNHPCSHPSPVHPGYPIKVAGPLLKKAAPVLKVLSKLVQVAAFASRKISYLKLSL